MKFSIGYNHDIQLLGLLDVYKEDIEALYFPIPRQYLGSGRHPSPNKNYIDEIPGIIEKCNALHIRSQLLLNATCEGESGLEASFFSSIVDYIRKLKELGLKSVVVTNPVYISEIKEQIRDIEIESSVNCYVRTIEHAVYLKDLGVDILTIDRDINRDIPLIKEIKNKTGLRIKMLLNEGCLRNCPFREMHFNFIAHKQPNHEAEMISGMFFEKWCTKLFAKNPAKIFSVPFIPPGALKYYTPFVDYFKIASRESSTSSIELKLKAYINQTFDGNLLSLLDCAGTLPYYRYIDAKALDENDFFNKMLECRSNCDECDYCSGLVNEAVVTDSYFLDPSHPVRMKESEKAVKIYKRILRTSPGAHEVHLNLASACFTLKDYEEAIIHATKAMEAAPKEKGPYLLLGSCYEQTKRNEDALEIYEKALEIFPDEGDFCLHLARTCFRLKRYEESIEKANKAIALNCEEGNLRFLLGLCYEKNRQYEKAIAELKKAEEINPEEAEINFSLFHCFRTRGQVEKANEELGKGVLKLKRSEAHAGRAGLSGKERVEDIAHLQPACKQGEAKP